MKNFTGSTIDDLISLVEKTQSQEKVNAGSESGTGDQRVRTLAEINVADGEGVRGTVLEKAYCGRVPARLGSESVLGK